MDSLLQAVGDFIARNYMWAGVLLGLVVFVESLAIVGAFVPATGLLVAAGGLIAAGDSTNTTRPNMTPAHIWLRAMKSPTACNRESIRRPWGRKAGWVEVKPT